MWLTEAFPARRGQKKIRDAPITCPLMANKRKHFFNKYHSKQKLHRKHDNMNAIAINKCGDVDVLEKVNVPKPTPQPRDLIVQSK